MSLISIFCFFVFNQSWMSLFLLLLLIGIPLISLILLLLCAKKTTLSVFVPDSVKRGQNGAVAVRCASSSHLPFAHALISIDIEDSISPIPTQLYMVSAGESVEIPFFTDHCAKVNFSFRKHCLCDMLGLFTLSRPVADMCTLVLPCSVPIIPKPRILNTGERTTRTKTGSGFSEVFEFRDYRPGDRLRDIHWKLSAKYNRYIVREPQDTVGTVVTIAVDIGSDPDECDFIFDRLEYLAETLLAENASMQIIWTDPRNGAVCEAYVGESTALFSMWRRLLAIGPCEYSKKPDYQHADSLSFFHLKCSGEVEG